MNQSNNVTICTGLNAENPYLDSVQTCYNLIVRENILVAILEIGLFVGTLSANIILIYLIKNSKDKLLIFDKILMGHSFLDFWVGALDLPFYHTLTMFDYWPYGEITCIAWSSFDSSANTISVLTMSYMAYSRYLSLSQPNTYKKNILVRNGFKVLILIWIVSVAWWFPINYVYIHFDYQYGTCAINYKGYSAIMLVGVSLFIPLLFITIMSIYVVIAIKLKERKKRSKKIKADTTDTTGVGSTKAEKKKKKEVKKGGNCLSPETRLTFIMVLKILIILIFSIKIKN